MEGRTAGLHDPLRHPTQHAHQGDGGLTRLVILSTIALWAQELYDGDGPGDHGRTKRLETRRKALLTKIWEPW